MSSRLPVVVLAFLVVVSACEGATTTKSESPTEEELVSFSIRLSPAEADFLARAEEELISRCMAERGFKYEVITAPVDPAAEERRYSLPNGDIGVAMTHGYGLRESFEQPAVNEFSDRSGPIDANSIHLSSLTFEQQKQWVKALHGTGEELLVTDAGEGVEQYIYTDGCIAAMEATLYGNLEEFVRITGVTGLAGADIYQRLVADPRWYESLRRWQMCMTQRGYAVTDLEDPIAQANDLYRSGIPLAEAQAREIEIAVDDAECAIRAGIGEVYESLVRRYEAEYATDHEADLAALQEIQDHAVEHAKALLGGS